jgi:hypothetical protein
VGGCEGGWAISLRCEGRVVVSYEASSSSLYF